MGGVAILLFAASAGLFACKRSDANATGKSHPEAAPPEAVAEAAPSAHKDSSRPIARISRVIGEPVPNELAAGRELVGGDVLVVPAGLELVIDWKSGARIEVGSSSRVKIGSEAPAALVVGRGRVHGILPPSSSSARPPLRIASPAVVVEIERSGQTWVVALPDASAWVAQLAGASSLLTGKVDEAGGALAAPLRVGRAAHVGGDLMREKAGPLRVEEAVKTTEELLAGTHESAPVRSGRDFATTLERLEVALRELERERARGVDLMVKHRRLAQKGAETQTSRRELVGHSQALFRGGQVLLARWERALATSLLLEGTRAGQGADELLTRRLRVRDALGLD